MPCSGGRCNDNRPSWGEIGNMIKAEISAKRRFEASKSESAKDADIYRLEREKEELIQQIKEFDMPCYDGRADDEARRKRNAKEVEKLRGMLCAVLTELEEVWLDDNGLTEIIANADRRGKSSVSEWWDEHKKNDLKRIADVLDGLSDHELELLNKIQAERKSN